MNIKLVGHLILHSIHTIKSILKPVKKSRLSSIEDIPFSLNIVGVLYLKEGSLNMFFCSGNPVLSLKESI